MSGDHDPRLVSPLRADSVRADSVRADSVRADSAQPTAFDPLRLYIFATVALLGWLLGPIALIFFAGLGFSGYLRARRAGLTRSQCLLRDTRLVLAYLGVLIVAGAAGLALAVKGYWLGW